MTTLPKLKAGDKVLVKWHNGLYEDEGVFVLEEYVFCLGFFKTEDHRTAHKFTPLSDLMKPADERTAYISNFGSHPVDVVPMFELVSE